MNNKAYTITFEENGINRFLLKVINIGTYDIPQLKFTFGHTISFVDVDVPIINQDKLDESDKITKGLIPCEICEYSYHFDGSFLRKLPTFPVKQKTYLNPYGPKTRITPLDKIIDIMPVFVLEIKDSQTCQPYKQTTKKKSINYKCINNELFNHSSYKVIIYLKNKDFIINQYTTNQFYSDIVGDISSKLEIAIYIQQFTYEKPQPIYSQSWKGYITPANFNAIYPCYPDSKNEICRAFSNNIFDKTFHEILCSVNSNEIIHITKQKKEQLFKLDSMKLPIQIKRILTIAILKT